MVPCLLPGIRQKVEARSLELGVRGLIDHEDGSLKSEARKSTSPRIEVRLRADLRRLTSDLLFLIPCPSRINLSYRILRIFIGRQIENLGHGLVNSVQAGHIIDAQAPVILGAFE